MEVMDTSVKEPMFQFSVDGETGEEEACMRKDVYDELVGKARKMGKTIEQLIFEIIRPEKNNSKLEFVEVKVKLPRGLVDFLKSHETSIGSIEEYLTHRIIAQVKTDLDSSCEDNIFFDREQEIKRWGLKEIFDC